MLPGAVAVCCELTVSSGDLANSWLETDLTLTNVETGEAVGVQNGLEYYFGVEGGESWSEGSKSNSEVN